MWGWLVAALLLVAFFILHAVSDRRLRSLDASRRAVAAAEDAERERLARLPLIFAHYRERLEFVRERLAEFLADPAREPGVDLDDWPRRAREFAQVLGPGSEAYHVLAAAYRGVTTVRHSGDPEQALPVLRMVDRALCAVDEAIDKVVGARR